MTGFECNFWQAALICHCNSYFSEADGTRILSHHWRIATEEDLGLLSKLIRKKAGKEKETKKERNPLLHVHMVKAYLK